jgi:hypothetical protein
MKIFIQLLLLMAFYETTKTRPSLQRYATAVFRTAVGWIFGTA